MTSEHATSSNSLQKARAIEQAATSGPWEVKSGSTPHMPARLMGRADVGTPLEHGVEVNLHASKNMEFVAQWRTLAPLALAVIERLRALDSNDARLSKDGRFNCPWSDWKAVAVALDAFEAGVQ